MEQQIYDELVRIARHRLGADNRRISLQPADLVHAAYLKVQGMEGFAAKDRSSILALMAHQMRFVLSDYFKNRTRKKRDAGGPVVRLDSGVIAPDHRPIEVLALEEALSRLEARRPRVARVFVSRYFGGMTNVEVAEAEGVSERTVKSDWQYARAWIIEQLGLGDSADD